MFHGNAAQCKPSPEFPKTGRRISGADIYQIAESSGLHYGPAFRLVSDVTVHSGHLISVELVPQQAPTPFLLDPMRLDCCSHGVLTAFPRLRAAERGVTYIPVQLDESALFRAHDAPQRALIEILGMSERSIVANYHIYGSDGELVAVFCWSYTGREYCVAGPLGLTEPTCPAPNFHAACMASEAGLGPGDGAPTD